MSVSHLPPWLSWSLCIFRPKSLLIRKPRSKCDLRLVGQRSILDKMWPQSVRWFVILEWRQFKFNLILTGKSSFISKLCCATLRFCFSPLVALWPAANLWVTRLRHHAIWGSPFSHLINHNTSSQSAGSSSFCGCDCIVSSTSIFRSDSFLPSRPLEVPVLSVLSP